MKPISSFAVPADDIVTIIDQWGVAQLKDAIPLRRAVALSADAVDYYLVRKLPGGRASILCNVPDAALGGEVALNTGILQAVCGGKAGDVARAYFRRHCGTEEFIVPWVGLHVRVIPAGGNPGVLLPYHQDAYVFPADWAMINGWTLLYPAATGTDAAGLEFIPGPITEVLGHEPNPTHPTMPWIEASRAGIDDLLARHGAWVPDIELGDVMLFNQLAPHRTHCSNPSKPRIAVEVRMIAKEARVVDEYGRNGIPYFTVTTAGISGPRRARIVRPIEALAD
jgi:hypothetical protein